ncbi:nucleotidyltransferase family protein [Methylotuvimicrobium sp. KM2]|uniref:nucleotidyltransferase domain-containing protein n=1 Tax=Methylotuvimicrobium sp. KM2 TaxID=3133976 RepID=UPI0031017C05
MQAISKFVLNRVYIKPSVADDLNTAQWEMLIRQARAADMLARLAWRLKDAGIFDSVSVKPRVHLESALIHADRFELSLTWEIECIQSALSFLDIPIVYLKGAAYRLADDQAAHCRVFSDIDILVAEDKLPEVERALIKDGWMTTTLDAYDQKYYRQWMHEIPPMRHLKRQTTLDVHHNILPKTCRYSPDSAKLLSNCVKVVDRNCWVLAPEDRVLHSASHLFHEGELDHGFRDLCDLDSLIQQHSEKSGFWDKLLLRADELNQRIPLYYALRYTHALLDTPIPENVLHESEGFLKGRFHRYFMDFLYLRALMPNHASCGDRWTGLARWLLYIRSHWLRMPFYLLIPHLFRKSWLRLRGDE